MIILKTGWCIDGTAEVQGGFVVAGNLRIPIEQVEFYITKEGEIVWVEDLVICTTKRWCYRVCSYWHTVFNAIKGKQK